MNLNHTDKLLNEKEARVVLRMSTAWLHKRRQSGLPPKWFKVGRRVFYKQSDLELFIAACAVPLGTEDRSQ